MLTSKLILRDGAPPMFALLGTHTLVQPSSGSRFRGHNARRAAPAAPAAVGVVASTEALTFALARDRGPSAALARPTAPVPPFTTASRTTSIPVHDDAPRRGAGVASFAPVQPSGWRALLVAATLTLTAAGAPAPAHASSSADFTSSPLGVLSLAVFAGSVAAGLQIFLPKRQVTEFKRDFDKQFDRVAKRFDSITKQIEQQTLIVSLLFLAIRIGMNLGTKS